MRLATFAAVWWGGACHGGDTGGPVDAEVDATIDGPVDAAIDASIDAASDAAGAEPCPTGPLGADLARSGTRLCARFEVAPGGARKLLGFRDRELGIDCTLDRSSPTTARCLPPMPELDAFADPGCSQPLLVTAVEAPCGTYQYAARASNTSCPHGQLDQIFAIGAEVFPAVTYHRYADGTCGVEGAPNSNRYFTVAPVPMTQFAVAHRVDDAAAPGRLHASRWQGEDGSSSSWFLRDELLDTDCTPGELDGVRRCVPVSLGPNTFSDAACTSPIGGIFDECAAVAPGVLESPAFIADQFTHRFYRRGAAAMPATIYRGSGGDTCSSSATQPGVRYFRAGAEVPVATLATYQQGPRTTGARIEPVAFSSGADPIVDDGQFYDTLLAARCRTGLAADESRRCVPDGDLGFAHLYTDAQCLSPVDVLTTLSYVTWVPNQYALVGSPTGGACPGTRYRVVRRGPEHAGSLYVAFTVGFPPQRLCMPAPGVFWDVGPDVAPTELSPMDLAEQ